MCFSCFQYSKCKSAFHMKCSRRCFPVTIHITVWPLFHPMQVFFYQGPKRLIFLRQVIFLRKTKRQRSQRFSMEASCLPAPSPPTFRNCPVLYKRHHRAHGELSQLSRVEIWLLREDIAVGNRWGSVVVQGFVQLPFLTGWSFTERGSGPGLGGRQVRGVLTRLVPGWETADCRELSALEVKATVCVLTRSMAPLGGLQTMDLAMLGEGPGGWQDSPGHRVAMLEEGGEEWWDTGLWNQVHNTMWKKTQRLE